MNVQGQNRVMAPYSKADPSLDLEFTELITKFETQLNNKDLKSKANKLALKIRGRCIELSVWKADYCAEYSHRIDQCKILTKLSDDQAHEFLIAEFGNV